MQPKPSDTSCPDSDTTSSDSDTTSSDSDSEPGAVVQAAQVVGQTIKTAAQALQLHQPHQLQPLQQVPHAQVAQVLKETFQAAARAAQQQASSKVVSVLHRAAAEADHAAQLLQVQALQEELAAEKAARQQELQQWHTTKLQLIQKHADSMVAMGNMCQQMAQAEANRMRQ